MISVVVLTKNEEDRIQACLESVKWANEIIIVDDGSEDETLKIARNYAQKIISSRNADFSERRNQGMEQAHGEWILYLDADERVLKSLKEELQKSVENSQNSAYAISRRNIIFGQEVSYGPYKKDWMIRFFKKADFKTWVGKVHEYATFDGNLGYTKNSLLHLTHRSVDHFIFKTLSWSDIYANLLKESNHPKIVSWRLFRILLTESFKQGIIRKGFFSGTIGVIDSILQVFSQFVTYSKLWELQQNVSLKDVYDDIDRKLLESEFKNYK